MVSMVFLKSQRKIKMEITKIPKSEALILMSEAILEELINFNTVLDLEIIKIRGIKKELLKLK